MPIERHASPPWAKGKRKKRYRFNKRKQSNKKFYNSKSWRRLRIAVLSKQPFCEACAYKGIVTPATVVDHIIPINAGGSKLNVKNLMALCAKCHNKKSAKEAKGSLDKPNTQGLPMHDKTFTIKKL